MTEKLTVGIALTTDPERSRGQLEEFCRCLSVASGTHVTAHGMWQYQHLLEALAGEQLDLVWLPPVLALQAAAQGHCVPIALPVRHGVSSYSATLFARADSPLRSPSDLVAASAAWVDRQSAAGYLIIRAYLRSLGIILDDAIGSEVFLRSHDAVASAVDEGRADVGATFAYLDERGAPIRAGWGERAMRMVCHAGPIPADVIAASHGMPLETQEKLQRALVSSGDPELARAARNLLGADGFVVPDDQHLHALMTVLQNLEEADGPGYTLFPPPPRRT